MGYPLWKNVNFSSFWCCCIHSLERCFFVLEYRKGHFPMLHCRKKKVGKRPIFGPNHGLICLEKSQFFGFLNLFFYSLKGFIFVLEYRKRHFPGLYCLKKKLEKWPFLDQSHGLTPLEKWQFFDFLNFLFFWPKKAFFRSRIS